MRFLTVIFLLLLALPLQATVYKWTDESGQIHYADQWREGAKAVDLPEPSVYSPRPLPAPASGQTQTPSAAERDPASAYDRLEVVSPAVDETIRNNEGKVSVSLRLNPTLRKGDLVELFIDGRQLDGKFSSTAATVSNLDRGTHSLKARVVDANGRELIGSAAVNFHIRRESRLFPNRQRTGPPSPSTPRPGQGSP